MGIGSIYRNYFKNNLFMKIILFFSVITIVTIITFSYLMFMFMSQAAVQRQMDVQKRAMESVSNYIGGKYGSVQEMVRDIYRDSELSYNTSYFLEHPYQDYMNYRLDRFYEENSSATDTMKYFQNVVDDDLDICSLMLYSANQQQLYAYSSVNRFKIIPANAARSYIPDVMYQQEGSTVALTNIWIRKTLGLPDQPMYSVRVPINNRQSLRNIGQLVVYFDTEKVWDSLANYKEDFKGSILVLSGDGLVLFDSSGQYYGRRYPYLEQVNSLYDNHVTDEGMIYTKLTQSKGGFTILSAVPSQELAKTYRGLRNTIVTVSSICILFAILLPSIFISNFAKRTHGIIRFTRRVRNGDLSARIADVREDELGQISKSFNDMLDELNLYIDRVYKAGIKQKQTELVSLQARINPHFLYNTLEVIRMRAVSQGARDVGEMIYSLSVLFKSLVQHKKIYTLKDELEACRLYLELFRIRYKDRFDYSITLEPGLESKSVMKLSLQPVIENYIVHGIKKDQMNNRLEIRVKEEEDTLVATVTDNGKGITTEKLAEIREELEKPEETGQMFGLRSVHSRLRYLYGPVYGIEIESKLDEGTSITIRYPNREGSDAEDV